MVSQESDPKPYWQHASYKDKIRAEGQPFIGTWRIHYTSSNGEQTIRTIVISHFLPRNESGHILGMCKLRGQERAFYIGRIQRAYDLQSCALIENPIRYIDQKRQTLSTAALQESIQQLLRIGCVLVETVKKAQAFQSAQAKPRKPARAKRL